MHLIIIYNNLACSFIYLRKSLYSASSADFSNSLVICLKPDFSIYEFLSFIFICSQFYMFIFNELSEILEIRRRRQMLKNIKR
jgi:hypothetical protein